MRKINNFKNRLRPVFIFSIGFYLAFALQLTSCKAKQDWRENYKKEKTKKESKKSFKSSTTKNNHVQSLEDIAVLLDTDIKQLKNKQLYNFIIEWYGVPYEFGGVSKSGIDCSGFTNHLYKNIYDTQLPRSSKDIAENVKRKYTKDLEEGDLLFFTFGKSPTINHVGVYLRNNKFVHASTSKGVIISDITEPWYGNYLVKCGSYNQKGETK